MDLRIFIEPQQGASYDDQLRVALAAERLGFGGFFRSDHYLHMGSVSGLPGPTDAWTTLAGLARETTSIRLGTLVSSATFRLPGVLAIQVAQVDQMSGGRVELGLGAGWFEAEHTAYGIPFPARRFDLLTEQLEIVTGLWGTPVGQTFTHRGQEYTLVDSPALPKPVQSPLPVIVGGGGPRRTPALAARFAAEYNLGVTGVPADRSRQDTIDAACEAVGRDPASLVRSTAMVVCCGSTEAEVAARAAAIGREVGELRANGLTGSPAEVIDHLAAAEKVGIERVYLQLLDLSDIDHLELIAREVAPAL